MAILLLAALVALGLLHVWPRLAQRRADPLFGPWLRQLADTSGWGRVVLAVGVPLLLCVLLEWLLGRSPLGDLARLLFAVLVLLYCLGPREFEADLEAILAAPDRVAREAAAQRLAPDAGDRVAWNAHALGEAIALAALRRRFGVLLWFFLLGPAGALLYRLAQTLGREEDLRLDPAGGQAARYLANALDWLPAQLLVFTLALVGHWDAVTGAWRRWRQGAAAGDWYARGPGFLGAAACADIAVEIEAGDGYAEERADPLLELKRMRSAFLRALLAWLSVVALVVLGGWIA
ncbi:beta-lactamase induction protein [Fulvimonas soli]|jgi:AmpE protein|uniref:AmpE protein n=1 Tax=Fulvimonas soli TaxID=155197 RepID=A0A316IH40_9GAMM|nr:beta-lactamase induction protein [Fulvimonas soli]PWK92393.1 AmpE protein [Fulvimonas soli]TNY25908.1 beta-lactamase induction protein [Fulvimonas soli]